MKEKRGTKMIKRLLATVCAATLLLGLLPGDLGSVVEVNGADFNLSDWRNTWRGNNLGISITAAQLDEIASGTLTTIELGDYWTIDNVTYRVADYDYYYDGTSVTDHDLVLVPDEALATMKIDKSPMSNADGYYKTTGRTALQSTIKEALPDDIKNNLLTHNMYMSTATASSSPYKNNWELKESNGIELMSIAQVYGADYVE